MFGAGLVETIGVVAGFVLAAVFVVAAAAKLSTPEATAADFASMGLPEPAVLARAVPVVELVTAAALVLAPGWGGVLAFALLAGFTVNLYLVIRSGRVATCACFGGAAAEPVSNRHLIRNAVLAALAILAATVDGWIWQIW